MATYICTHCGWEGETKRQLRGSKAVEVLIWSVLLLPGPLYSFWRRTGRSKECPHCNLSTLVKASSDAGWVAKRRFDLELGLAKPQGEEKKEPKDERNAFGNDRPAESPTPKKPVDPEAW